MTSRTPFFFLLGPVALGLCLAPQLEAVTVRVATFNIQNGPDPAGTPDYEATKAVLSRIDADVVAFQEILVSGTTNRVPVWQQMGAELGYAHVSVGTSASGIQRLGYFSRFPITQTNNLSSVFPADEFTRRPMRVVVDVTGALKPLVLWTMHHKADEPNAPDVDVGNRNNQLRRAVEALRIAQDISNYNSNNPTHDEFVLLGDLNDDSIQSNSQAMQFSQADYNSFKTNSALLPSSFVIGSDIQFPILYRAFPDDRYAAAGGGLHRLDLRQQNGSSRATRGSRTLDYILVSTALRDSPLGAPRGEVYNSQLDTANTPGLPKTGAPLASGTSLAASDHLAVFADIEMDDALLATVVVSPEEEIVLSGDSGGPFTPTVAAYKITNPTSQPIEVAVSADVPWLQPDFSSGMADGLGEIALNVLIDAAAAPTTPGEYVGRVRITETGTGAAVVRSVRLRVNSTGFDFLTQQFSGSTPFNLANMSLTFAPDGSPSFYRATTRAATALPVDPAGGTSLALGDDAFAVVNAPPGRVLRIFGRSESQLFVGSNGYVTFLSGDTDFSPTLEDHFRLPRISAAFQDLDPRTIGTVSYRWLTDRIAVTWSGVPRYGETSPNTFQVELFDDGRIRITWLQMGDVTPIIGLSPGIGLSVAFEGSLFSTYPSTLDMPLAFEDFVRGYGLDPLGNGALSADPDGDGHSNLREFLFGGLPAQANGALSRYERQASALLLSFIGRESGVSYRLMSSGDLAPGTWVAAVGLDIQDSPDQEGVPQGYKRRQVFVPDPAGNRFYRFEASESSP